MQQKSILICRYQSICEPDVIQGFQKSGYQVEEFTEIMEDIDGDVRYLELLAEKVKNQTYDFIFSINFFPIISKLCNAIHLLYVCWVVDCPLITLYSEEIFGEYNRIFIFDRAMYQYFQRRNPEGIFHLPLAANVVHSDKICSRISEVEYLKYQKDITLVGSLYTEKCLYNGIGFLPETLRECLELAMRKQMFTQEPDYLEEALTKERVAEFKEYVRWEDVLEDYKLDDRKFIKEEYLGIKVSEMERIELLQQLSKQFQVALFTQSDTAMFSLENVLDCGSAESRIQMPKIFHCSRINLNPAIKTIKTGISQRAWDILGAGGFLLSSKQSELLEYFQMGKDMEWYESLEELQNKCEFYLREENERVRKEIAGRGYELVKKYHTYDIRISQMLKILKSY